MCSDANRDTRSSALRGSCPGTGRALSKCILELGHEPLIQIYPVFCSPFGCWHQRPGWAWDPKAQRYLQSFGAWSCAPFPCLEAGVNAWTSGVWGTRCTLLAQGCVCRVGWGVVLLLPGVKFTPAPPQLSGFTTRWVGLNVSEEPRRAEAAQTRRQRRLLRM